MLWKRGGHFGQKRPDRAVLAHDLRHRRRTNYLHRRPRQLPGFEPFELFQLAKSLRRVGARILLQYLHFDLVHVVFVPLLHAVGDPLLDLVFHTPPSDSVGDLVFYFRQDGFVFIGLAHLVDSGVLKNQALQREYAILDPR